MATATGRHGSIVGISIYITLLALASSVPATAAKAHVNKATKVVASLSKPTPSKLVRSQFMYDGHHWVRKNSSAARAQRIAAQKCCCNRCLLKELSLAQSLRSPYSAVALVQFVGIDSGRDVMSECTATMIGPRLMLTAGHCVIKGNSFRVTDGYAFFTEYRSMNYGPAIRISRWAYWNDWKNLGLYRADQAVLLLESSPGNKYPARPYADFSKVAGTRSVISLGFPHFPEIPFDVNILAYSTTKNARFNKLVSKNSQLQDLVGTYTLPLSIGEGMSGGPVFDTKSNAIVATNDWSAPSLFGCSREDYGCYNGYTPVDNKNWPIPTLVRIAQR